MRGRRAPARGLRGVRGSLVACTRKIEVLALLVSTVEIGKVLLSSHKSTVTAHVLYRSISTSVISLSRAPRLFPGYSPPALYITITSPLHHRYYLRAVKD